MCVYTHRYIDTHTHTHIYIEVDLGEPWLTKYLYFTPYFHFENPNDRSEPLNVISILKCAWRPNFTFLEFSYYLLSNFENCCFAVNSKNFWTIRSAIFKVA